MFRVPWVEREPEDSLSTLTEAWADVQGEVEDWKAREKQSNCKNRHGTLGGMHGALCKGFHHWSTMGTICQQTRSMMYETL